MTHDAMTCMERPLKVDAKLTSKHYSMKRLIPSSWIMRANMTVAMGMNEPAMYACVIEIYEQRAEAKTKYLKGQQLKKLQENKVEDASKVDDAKVDENEQMDFAKVKKRECTIAVVAQELLGE
ncbi:hypothetical protein NE237_012246 [Protea cynaroides]|uniref:Pre-mRNA-splicing factor SLU7 n=1 Tax=Protea cynaroides TaxID=273540 RepID=A0A9Q0GZG0_9MAGN|nr:hypothetical protein NE237_012246 [Protea cynaroides]